MAYGKDMAGSARRHLRAAQELNAVTVAGAQPGCRAVAGYLLGLSGELATKAMMLESGIVQLPPEDRRDDPYYAHFPELKARLRDVIRGRRSSELRRVADSPTMFQFWDTDMRYAPTSDIRPEWIDSWRADAEYLVTRIGG